MIAKKSSGAGCRFGLSATGIRSVEYKVDSAENPSMRSSIGGESLAAPWRSQATPLISPESPVGSKLFSRIRTTDLTPRLICQVGQSFSAESYFEVQPPLGPLVSWYRSFAAETLFYLCESSKFRSASARSPERHESGPPRRQLSETRSAGKSRVRIHKNSARDSQRKV